jgi:exonuclease III
MHHSRVRQLLLGQHLHSQCRLEVEGVRSNQFQLRSTHSTTSLPYREKWDEAFLTYLKELDAKKPVVWCGDLNVSTQLD